MQLKSTSPAACLGEAIRRTPVPFKFLSGRVAGCLNKCERETDNFAEKQET